MVASSIYWHRKRDANRGVRCRRKYTELHRDEFDFDGRFRDFRPGARGSPFPDRTPSFRMIAKWH